MARGYFLHLKANRDASLVILPYSCLPNPPLLPPSSIFEDPYDYIRPTWINPGEPRYVKASWSAALILLPCNLSQVLGMRTRTSVSLTLPAAASHLFYVDFFHPYLKLSGHCRGWVYFAKPDSESSPAPHHLQSLHAMEGHVMIAFLPTILNQLFRVLPRATHEEVAVNVTR